jgi:hypothetical protein
VLEACHLYASEAGPRAHVELLKIGRLRSVPINGFPKLFDEASAAIERLTWLDRYRTAASLPNCPGFRPDPTSRSLPPWSTISGRLVCWRVRWFTDVLLR